MASVEADEQLSFDFVDYLVAGEVLAKIRKESRDEAEKGRWFEHLFMRVVKQSPELEIEDIWRWPDWPDREAETGLDGRDIGVDLVARRTSGEWVAIQCKCYDSKRTLPKGEIDKFLGGSQHKAFGHRWIVATCKWGPNAESAIKGANPQVSRIDFHEYAHVELRPEDAKRPIQEPWPLQNEAIEHVVDGLTNHDRGRLIMACGTGKTFTSLRITEQMVEKGGRILFAAPTIALVSQARREWLRQTTRKLRCLVVCLDPTAGGRNENEDIGISELECPVTTNVEEIEKFLSADCKHLRAVFCTYQSLRRVTEAQACDSTPAFNLAIADEAHRTTGARGTAAGKVNFQEFHDGQSLRASKRLYMTATPRIYTEKSKGKLKSQGIEVVDMGDLDVYGPELYRLPFAKAVDAKMLSDYRVIVLGVNEGSVTPALRGRLEKLDTGKKGSRKVGKAPSTNEMTRVLGVSLAVNGVTVGKALDQPGRLQRTMAFANSIRRSKWYAEALKESEVKRTTTRHMEEGQRAMNVVSLHLDASSSALERNRELRELAQADKKDECRVISNVKLFTEGVDVPQLDAVAFFDPRDSQVDVVQAVGRVMRKAEGKRFGYIIVPVVVPFGDDVVGALGKNTEGYKTIGRVLRALQAHDGRLAEDPANFVKVYEQDDDLVKPPKDDDTNDDQGNIHLRDVLALKEADQGIYAHVAAASGLGKPGQVVADDITDAVRRASAVFQDEEIEVQLANALDLVPETDGGARGVCTVAALMLCNACLLQRRLNDVPDLETERLDKVAGAKNPKEPLDAAWDLILEKDYAPVFRPALAILRALPERKALNDAIRSLAECANRVADSLSELGYDHAGPLYHRILGSATSDGAFYTNNLSAIVLARLAFTDTFVDWSDPEAVGRLRIMDPACGTGTLLMATLQTIKGRVGASRDVADEERAALHKHLVEDVICGLDINRHGIQLAACNMTLGAPTVDYTRMNLVTMPHGPQADGTVKAGSLEVLNAASEPDLRHVLLPHRDLASLDAAQVDESEDIDFPLKCLDGIIMNAPFTDNAKRGRKYTKDVLKQMQAHELGIRDTLGQRDNAAGRVITTNSIRTFFTPLAEQLLSDQRGVLAKVIPVTACTGAGGLDERRFLADRFHVERIVTTHDPKRIAFSENTSIHECLLVCRRQPVGERPATEFVSLRRMPETAEEAIQVAEAITSGQIGDWGKTHLWPNARVMAGDWAPAQWYDGELAEAANWLEENSDLQPIGARFGIGPDGRRIQDAYAHKRLGEDVPSGAVPGFHSISAKLRRTMRDGPDVWYVPKEHKASLVEKYSKRRSNLLVSMRFDTVAGRLTALWTAEPSFGWWVPVDVKDQDIAKALAVGWNATPVRLMLLNRRAMKLTYPTWQVAHLREIRIPRPDNPAWQQMRAAFDQLCDRDLLPMRQAEECEVRQAIDEAAAQAIGSDPETLADWRRILAAEPTVSNARAVSSHADSPV